MMVDWISAFCEARAWERQGLRMYDTGRTLLLSPDGEIERCSSRGLPVQGSFDTRLLVRSFTGSDLYLSGNPVKFIQGHNLFGPADPHRLFFDGGWAVRKIVGLFPSGPTWEAGEFEGPRFTRIDVTRSYRFGSGAEARRWLRFVAGAARTRHGGKIVDDGTVYFGKHSERWSLKIYHKFDELHAPKKGHRVPDAVPRRDELIAWAEGVVRFEVVLRAKELEKTDVAGWDALKVWSEYYGRVVWNQNVQMVEPDMLEQELPRELRRTLTIWRLGEDPRVTCSRRTFYRHRRELLGQLGVDIAERAPELAAPERPAAVLDEAGWDPEPIAGYRWDPEEQQELPL